MKLAMWMVDIAREQCPSLDHLRLFARAARDGGYNALGLYLEHRFAYPSAPWAAGKFAITPEMVHALQIEFDDLVIVPFINLLGHMEGFIYTETGKTFREALFSGLQGCPSHPELMQFCTGIIRDTVKVFDSELIHIGGDETQQLGACPLCAERVSAATGDGKAKLYAEHFGPLAHYVASLGRRPAIWGDMFAEHPTALDAFPAETVIFDWQYFNGIKDSSEQFFLKGHDVVGCPALHTYNATWLHLENSEQNVRQVVDDIDDLGGYGVCLTTWENALFGSYDTLIPAIRGAGKIITGDRSRNIFLREYLAEGERHEEWARLMGVELQNFGSTFAFGKIRSSLKVRFLLQANPFLVWLHHQDEIRDEKADELLEFFHRSYEMAPNEAMQGISRFARGVIEFLVLTNAAADSYRNQNPEGAIGKLSVTRKIFDDLEGVAKRTHERIGGSLADIERCRVARQHVERVIQRIRDYGDGSLGYLPSFEHITHPKFVPHDQGAWWLINKWANE